MSICHIQLRKINEQGNLVYYSANSPDFSPGSKDEVMAIVIVDKELKTYDFFPSQKWVDQKTIPPIFYSNSEEQQSKLLQEKYKGFGNGLWTEKIHRWISNFIENKEYLGIFPT